MDSSGVIIKLHYYYYWFISIVLIIVINQVQAGVSPLTMSDRSLNQNCKLEGQKIANPDTGDKFFLCHFYSQTNTWLLIPFNCASGYFFNPEVQRCLKMFVQSHQHGYPMKQGYFPEENLISEIQDQDFNPEHSILNRNEENTKFYNPITISRKNNGRINLDESQIKLNNWDETFKILTSTINTLSKTIIKLSERNTGSMSSPVSNNTISITFPNFSSIHQIFKPMDKKNENFVTFENKSAESIIVVPSGRNEISTIEIQSVTTTSTTPTPKSTKILTPELTKVTNTLRRPITITPKPKIDQRHPEISLFDSSSEENLQGGSLGSGSNVKPGNNFFDFLLKNIFKPIPIPIPQHIIQKNNPFTVNTIGPNSNPNNNHNPFSKPHPFIPKPNGFNPIRYYHPFSHNPQNHVQISTLPPSKPQPSTGNSNFVNLLSFINQLDQNLSKESDEDDGHNGHNFLHIQPITSKISTTTTTTTTRTPVTTMTTTTSARMTTPGLVVLPNTSSTVIMSNKTESSGIFPTVVSSDSTEFKITQDDEDDDEDDESGDPLRLNNRKPRRV